MTAFFLYRGLPPFPSSDVQTSSGYVRVGKVFQSSADAVGHAASVKRKELGSPMAFVLSKDVEKASSFDVQHHTGTEWVVVEIGC